MGHERCLSRLSGYSPDNLRARSIRNVPRLVRVIQYLPEILRPPSRRPPLLQIESQVSADENPLNYISRVFFVIPRTNVWDFFLFFSCNIVAVFAEVDRILRPEGKFIVRDTVEVINKIESMAKAAQWEVRLTYSKDNEGLLCLQKSNWRPDEIEELKYAIAS